VDLQTPNAARQRDDRRSVLVPVVAAVLGLVLVAGATLLLTQRGNDATSVVATPSTAREVFLQAGRLAARAETAPLQAGEFHYVRTLDFARQRAVDTTTANADEPAPWLLEGEQELWLGPDGDGRVLEVRAAMPAGAEGQAGTAIVNDTPVRLGDLGAARVVSDDRFRGGLRTRQGGTTVLDGDRTIEVPTPAAAWNADFAMSPESTAVETWGATLDEVAALPEQAGNDLDAAVAALIASSAEQAPGFAVAGRPAALQEAVAAQYEVDAAIRLLGAAPLSPAARQAVFTWLSEVPGATVEGDVRDHEGRRGTAVTFTGNATEQADPTRLPMDAAVRQALQADPGARVRRSGGVFELPGVRREHTWEQTVVVDPATGELLQSTRLEREVTTTSSVGLAPVGDGRSELRPQEQRAAGVSEGRRVWITRDRSTEIAPALDACETRPAACA
jgi:hypothetical protein